MKNSADFGYDWGMGSTLEENTAQLKYLTNTSTIQGGQMVIDGVEKSVRVKSIVPYRVSMPPCPTGMSCIQVMPQVPEVKNLAIYDPAIHAKPNYVGYFLGEDASIDRLFVGESGLGNGILRDYSKPVQPVQDVQDVFELKYGLKESDIPKQYEELKAFCLHLAELIKSRYGSLANFKQTLAVKKADPISDEVRARLLEEITAPRASIYKMPIEGTALNQSQMILPSPSPLTTTSPLPTHSPTPSSVEEKKINLPLIAGAGVLAYFLMS